MTKFGERANLPVLGRANPSRSILPSFDQIANVGDRRYFEDLPTSFHLPSSEVDRLREIAGVLLRASPAYQRLVMELDGEIH